MAPDHIQTRKGVFPAKDVLLQKNHSQAVNGEHHYCHLQTPSGVSSCAKEPVWNHVFEFGRHVSLVSEQFSIFP